jgi:tetratricopeptide (TPR) repeat protein
MENYYFLEILAFFRKHRFSFDGLVAILVLSGLLYYWFAKAVGNHILQVIKACGFHATLGLTHSFYLIGFFAVLLLAFMFWHRSRKIPKFSKNELGILFAPDFDEEVEREVNRLFVHLTQEIKSHEIGNRFSLKRLPPNLTISSPGEAGSMLRNSGGAVAVWGPLEHQSGEQGSTTGFSKFSITFIHRPTQLSKSRFETLAMSLVGRKFHIREKTKIVDRNIMARDIGFVVRNALGTKLLIDQKFQEAVKILGPLHINLQSTFPGKRPIPLKRFCLQVQYDFAYSLTVTTTQEYRDWLFNEKLYDIPSNILAGWLNNTNQALALDSQNSVHHVSKGIYLFLMGDVEGAIRAEKKAEQLAPKAFSVPNFSLAFLYNFKGNLKLSRNQYRIGLAKKTSYDGEMISQCIFFTRQSILKFSEKKQLRLALAVLELRRGSKELGIHALEEFMADAPHEPELKDFINEAQNLLERAKSDNSMNNDKLSGEPPYAKKSEHQ